MLKKILLLGALSSTFLTAADNRNELHVHRSPSTLYSYLAATRNSADQSPTCFAGAAGIPGGIDAQLIPFLGEIGFNPKKALLPDPRMLSPFKELMNHIRAHGGPSKDFVASHMQGALDSNTASPFMFVLAMLQGMRPTATDPRARNFLEHTRISDEFRVWSKLDFTKLFTGQAFLPFLKKSEFDNTDSDYSTHSYFSRNTPDEHHTSAVPYFGGIFGITTFLEMFCHRLGIIAIPTKSYSAHGCTFDPFSAILHDMAHAKQTAYLDNILMQTAIFVCDQHLAMGGSVQSFKELEKNTLYSEQTRFLYTILCLNGEAFRRWGLSETYNKFALGLFLWTHEIISFTSEMIYSSDFIGSFARMIDANIEGVQNGTFESPTDLLQTDPLAGISALTPTQIKDKFVKKYFENIKKDCIRTKEIERIEATLAQKKAEHKTKPTSALKTEIQQLKQDLMIAVKRGIRKTKITLKGEDFYDMEVQLTNGKNLHFSEPTLAFKRRNYADTKGLMGIAGIKLPAIPESADRATVQAILQQGIDAWVLVMNDLKEKIAYLTETMTDRSGRTLSRIFFDERFSRLEALKERLKAARDPNQVVAYDYRPKEVIDALKGW